MYYICAFVAVRERVCASVCVHARGGYVREEACLLFPTQNIDNKNINMVARARGSLDLRYCTMTSFKSVRH